MASATLHLNRCASGYVVNKVGRARRVTWNGESWLVAPIRAINCKGGGIVMSGSKGPLFYTSEDTAKAALAWNGKPITIDHPYCPDTGRHLSANDEGVWERQGVGVIKNARFVNDALDFDGWYNENRLLQISPETHERLLNGQPVEGSTGLFTDNEMAENGANHRGRPFEYYARNHAPDHFATLPHATGACGINDGCGVLVNKNGKQPTANGRGGNPKPCDDGT